MNVDEILLKGDQSNLSSTCSFLWYCLFCCSALGGCKHADLGSTLHNQISTRNFLEDVVPKSLFCEGI